MDLTPATAIGMSPFPVARNVFIGNLAVVCTGLVRGVVQRSRHRLYFVMDAGVKRPKQDSVIRKSPILPSTCYYILCR